MVSVTEEKWAESGNRLDFAVKVSRLFSSSYEFRAHVVGKGLNQHTAKDLADTMVEMIDQEAYQAGKTSYSFPMRSKFNATGYIYKKNFPNDSE